MPLINTAVPNLIQGVSQQSDASRFAGQCEEQENALSSVADGLKKRPNTRHIAKLMTEAIDEDSFVHFIDRDDNEKYVVIHNGTNVRVFNILTGVESSITCGCGTEYSGALPAGALPKTKYTYLDTSAPRTQLKALTVSDSTFIVNNNKQIYKGVAASPDIDKEFMVFIKQGDYKKEYGFDITRTITSSTTQTTNSAKAQLRVQTKAHTGGPRPYGYATGYQYEIEYITIQHGGIGFTVGEEIDIFSLMPQSRQLDWCEDDCSPSSPDWNWNGTAYLQASPAVGGVVPATPKATVSSVTSSGAITGLSYNNGVFCYQLGSYYYYKFGYGHTEQLSGGAFTIPNIQSAANPADQTISTSFPVTSSNKIEAVSGTSASSASENASTNKIIELVRDAAIANTAFNADFIINSSKMDSNLLIFTAEAGVANFEVSPIDGLGGNGIGVIFREVSSINDLPTVGKNGFQVKVAGDAELNEDDYYVKFQTENDVDMGVGAWIECVAPNTVLNYDTSCVPMELKSNPISPTNFLIAPMKIADRMSGDDDSNPLASFVDATISNLFFFKNRLGFLSRDNIIMTESGLGGENESEEFEFNFGRTTVTSLLDSDPIDIAVASSRVAKLSSAEGFQENLILFADNAQFVLKGGDLLTPKTVSVNPVTNFNLEDNVDPLPLGAYIYFPFTRGQFTGLREFTVNASTDVYDSTEITEHVPAYIPKNIIDMAGTTSEDMIVLLSGDEKGSLYIYNYFWNNNQKVLSAWSKFIFTGEVRGIEFIESTLYAVIANNGETNLVEMPLESGLSDTAGYVTHLDMRVASTVTNGNNQITLPYTPADNSVEVYTTDGLKLNATNSGATVTLAQAVTADTNVFVGIPYTMKYTFSEQLFKAKAGQGSSPSNAAKLMVRNGSIYFDKTAFFKVKVTPKHRDTTENVFTPDIVGSSTLGSLDLDSGFYRFPVFTKAQDTTITIENESALPSNFQSAEFESFLHSRSNRYG